MTNLFRDNGGYIPGLALITNNLGRPEHMVRRKKKRRPYMTIRRRSSYGGHFGTRRAWYVYCTKCPKLDTGETAVIASTLTWGRAITATTRHAHNHH